VVARAQEYEARINSGDIVAIAKAVRDLYGSGPRRRCRSPYRAKALGVKTSGAFSYAHVVHRADAAHAAHPARLQLY
jgi:hypothetical protein